MKKVGIIVPLAFPFGMVPQEFFLSFFRANEYLLANIKEDIQLELISESTFPLDANRNESVAIILEKGFDTSIWLDADQELCYYDKKNGWIGIDSLYRLIVNGDKYPIYAGMYYLKKDPYHPIVFNSINKKFNLFRPIWNYPTKSLFYAEMIGMGCVKIDREVFEALDRPYFKYGKVPVELAKTSPDMNFKYKNDVRSVSEDVHFWRQIKKKTDYKIVIDPMIQVGHITKHSVKPEMAIQYAYANKLISDKQKGRSDWFDETYPHPALVNGEQNPEWLFESLRQASERIAAQK